MVSIVFTIVTMTVLESLDSGGTEQAARLDALHAQYGIEEFRQFLLEPGADRCTEATLFPIDNSILQRREKLSKKE